MEEGGEEGELVGLGVGKSWGGGLPLGVRVVR